MGARLVLFNAFSLSAPPAVHPAFVPSASVLIRENNERLTRLAGSIAEAYQLEVSCYSTNDLLMPSLSRQVKKQHAELVVLGLKGHSLVTRLFGSTAITVLKNARFPVLIVPEEARFRGIRRMLFACEYGYLGRHTPLAPVQALAAAFRAQVEILHVEKEEPLQPKDRKPMLRRAPNLEEVLKGIKHSYRYLTEENVLAGIQQRIDEYHADMLVMVPHKASLWEALLHSSHTRQMALRSPIPLLALPSNPHAQRPARAARPASSPSA
ncbi:Universal stress protein family protein [Cesiribacter andamanensis AMV16]|uniref:Universal stress protein family protein n=2 Tax=Cesiribacter TaxID=1133570 RepID=M7NJI8_9BACT|nr:Universal stress protein family protein [Cesiribacter andamanensis AMV16]